MTETGRETRGRKEMADLILREAAALFQEKGYLGATTRELGDAVGIRGASVYYHFKTKEDILYGICLESLRSLTERVTEAAAGITSPAERLRAVIQAHVANILGDRQMHATMLSEVRHLSSSRRADVTGRRDAYERIIEDAISSAQAHGAVRSDIPARRLTLAALSLLNWTIFWYSPEGALSVDAIGALLATVFLEGTLVRAD